MREPRAAQRPKVNSFRQQLGGVGEATTSVISMWLRRAHGIRFFAMATVAVALILQRSVRCCRYREGMAWRIF